MSGKLTTFVFSMGFIMGGIMLAILSDHIATQRTIEQFQQAAVKARAAKWIADENGKAEFAWIVCTALGTGK